MAHSEMKSLSAEVGMQDYELSQIQERMKPAAGTIKHSVTRFNTMLSVSSVYMLLLVHSPRKSASNFLPVV